MNFFHNALSPCRTETKRTMIISFAAAASFVSQKSRSGSRQPPGSIFTNKRDTSQLQLKMGPEQKSRTLLLLIFQ